MMRGGAVPCVPDAAAVLRQHGWNNGCSSIAWAEVVAGVRPRKSPVTLVNVRLAMVPRYLHAD